MRKILSIVFGIVVFVLFLFYFVLFTQPGNNLLKPTIESRINKELHINMKLENFSLRPSTFLLKFKTPNESYFLIKGQYGLFSKYIDAQYEFNVSTEEKALAFKSIKLKGAFFARGAIRGLIKEKLTVDGLSNIAKGKTNYSIILKNLKPIEITAKINNMKISKILYTLNKPEYAKALLNADIDFKDLSRDNLKGTSIVRITDGKIDRDVMKNDFNINVPAIQFESLLKINLDKNLSYLNFGLNSNIGNSKINGNFNQDIFHLLYDINISKLAVLKPITNIALRGAFSTNGKIDGKIDRFIVAGISSIAKGKTNYSFIVERKKIKNISMLIKNARLEDILYLLNQPKYASGLVSSNITIDNTIMKNLSGKIEVNIEKGSTNSAVIKKIYKVSMPRTTFNLNLDSTIKQSIANYSFKLKSLLGSIDLKDGIFNIPKTAVSGNYTIDVPNLDRLYFLSKRHLRGNATVTGSIKKDKNLTATANSKMFGGLMKVNLLNDNMTGSAKGIQAVDITDMLIYPRIFDSKGNVNFAYNLLSKKGTISSKFINGHILPNEVTFLLKQMARFDITREIYKQTTIESKINNGIVLNDLDMQSRLTHITSKNALIDLSKHKIDAKLRIDIKNKPVYVTLKGDLNSPKIRLDVKSLFRNKVKKKINKILEKENLNNLLKGFK